MSPFETFLNSNIPLQLLISILVIPTAIISSYFFKKGMSRWLKPHKSSQHLANIRSIILPTLMTLFQWITVAACREFDWNPELNQAFAEMLTAWMTVRYISLLSPNHPAHKPVGLVIYAIAVLNVLGVFPHVLSIMENLSVSIGELHISLLSVIKGAATFIILFWATSAISKKVEQGLKGSKSLERSLQELFSKLIRVSFLAFSLIITLSNMGLDLSAFAIFGGAIGVGIGFGLQKVVSNLICGIILLLDRSIKPGDVIALEQGKEYGEINKLGARCVSVRTRSGKEHLIPNEDFITHKSENWSYSDSQIRLSLPMRAGLDSDVHLVLQLLVEAAKGVDRVLNTPAPGARLRSFSESAIEFEVRVWIGDPHNGVSKVKSDIYVNIWDLFKQNDIKIPYPQRDLHIVQGPKSKLLKTNTDLQQGLKSTIADYTSP